MLAIHAGYSIADTSMTDRCPVDRFPDDAYAGAGHIVGVVDIVDVAPSTSPWAIPDHHHWRLENPRRLSAPLPARGLPGLWIPPQDVTAALLSQLGTAADAPPTDAGTDGRDDPRPATPASSRRGPS